MEFVRNNIIPNGRTVPRLPSWISTGRIEEPEDMAFLSGAALSHLHIVLAQDELPHALLRDRLALRAAEACVAFTGRPERAGELRDAIHLLRLGDLPGPAGEIYLSWRRAVEAQVSVKTLCRVLPRLEAGQIATWLNARQGGPVSRAASALEAVLNDVPRGEVPALILADAILSQALGWDRLVPVLASHLKRSDLGMRRHDLRLACHRAVIQSVIDSVRLAAEILPKADYLRTVAPRLRAKQAIPAIEMFIARDAVVPSALPMPDRAARRLCDRLVELGAVRELTGRSTFRLYGL